MVARYGAIWYQLTFSFCNVASERNGTMVKGMPVETVWMGRFSSSSATWKAEHLGDNVVRMRRAELRFGLTHLAEEQTIALLEAHRNLADLQVEYDLIRTGVLAQVPGGAERGMSGEGQLFVHRKDADLVALAPLDVCIARQDVRGLRQIGFARQLLHLIVAQATGVAEDRELIALERAAGKHIKLDKREFALGHGKAPSQMYQDAAPGRRC